MGFGFGTGFETSTSVKTRAGVKTSTGTGSDANPQDFPRYVDGNLASDLLASDEAYTVGPGNPVGGAAGLSPDHSGEHPNGG